MNKTLEFYRKLAEAYKEHDFDDYAVAELWTALEKAVLANAELVEALYLGRDACQWMADATDSDPEDHERLAIVVNAIQRVDENGK